MPYEAGGIYRYMNVDTNTLGAYYYKAVYTFESGAEIGTEGTNLGRLVARE